MMKVVLTRRIYVHTLSMYIPTPWSKHGSYSY